MANQDELEQKDDNGKAPQKESKRAYVKRDRTNSKSNIIDGVLSVLLYLLGIFFFLSSVSLAGNVGDFVFKYFHLVFGWTAFTIFIPFLYTGYYLWKNRREEISISSIMFLVIALFSLTSFTSSIHIGDGGLVGNYLSTFLLANFGKVLPPIISVAVALISFIFIYEDRPRISELREEKLKEMNQKLLEKSGHISKNIFSNIFIFFKNILRAIFSPIFSIFKKKKKEIKVYQEEDDEIEEESVKIISRDADEDFIPHGDNLHSELLGGFKSSRIDESNMTNGKNVIEESELMKVKSKSTEERRQSIKEESRPVVIEEKFVPPSVELLNSDSGKSSAGDSKFKMNVIQKVLDQFSIPVEMGEVTVGPSVTQFTLKPAQGVNVRKILGLKDNLQMALSATNMHIEAPIPGKPFVGIEIPNEKKTMLGLRSLIELPEFEEGPALSLAIGKNIIGKPVISDLAKMPHLLMAGATGTGKSVTLHNLIISLLYKNSPHDLKLIILDPKRVEFTAYNALPHLYTPIIKDAKTAIKTLNWAAQEMDRRYDVLGEYGVPNLGDYNKKIFLPALEKAKKRASSGDIVSNLPPKMPYIVIVFDEFNDFMLSYPKEITPVITSLSQKARAAGIHLILTTQRPDVKVITGTIKANIPSRIALKTTSQVDSRTILDQAGAEDLLGNGDMLYMNGSSIIRVQAPFVSSEEIKNVINTIKKKYDDFLPDEINLEKVKINNNPAGGYREMEDGEGRSATEEPTDDEDYMSARDYVISTGKASTSSLQTAFRWGYNKAARIINDLEMYGVIGPATSGRHREVLYGKEQESEVEKLERELKDLESKEETE